MYKNEDVTFIIPTRNNANYLDLALSSVQKYEPLAKIIVLDDGSDDNTIEIIKKHKNENLNAFIFEICYKPIGHTILYDFGIEKAETELVTILHADMVICENYLSALLDIINKNVNIMVCATRIEPPLHPEGNEKITYDLGQYYYDFNEAEFSNIVNELRSQTTQKLSNGVFAPWLVSKKTFMDIGGHDEGFAPFPYEDSDLFQRWILAGYDVFQSWESYVYHFTCRGHKWENDKINSPSKIFFEAEKKARDYYLKKWKSWIQVSEYGRPIIDQRYDYSNIIKKPYQNFLKINNKLIEVI